MCKKCGTKETTFHFRLSVILGVLILLCTLSACNKVSDTLVGKWFNESEKCLDIRSDGSWELEGYGTGTWKLLDDGIFEFTDFYGDTQKSTINHDETGLYIDFGYYGNFYKDAFPKSESDSTDANPITDNDTDSKLSPESTPTIEHYPISRVCAYGEGYAWVYYNSGTEEKDKKTYALVDISGQEVYSFSAFFSETFPMSGGLCMYKLKEGSNTNTYLIDTKGNVVASSENGDNILAYGDGLALLYKYEGGIQTSKHLYGIIDKKGNWVQEYRDLDVDPDLTDIYREHRYVGNGMFAIDRKDNGDYLFFNSNDGNVFYLYNSELSSSAFKFIDDYAPVTFDSFWTDPVISNVPLTAVYDTPAIDASFLLKTDGTYKILEDFDISKDYISGGNIIRDKGEYLDVYNYKSGKTIQIKKYTQLGTTLSFFEDYGLLITTGEDRNSYFTLVNTDGTSRFEPICGKASYYSEGYVAYESNGSWYICDKDGNLIMENIYKIYEFTDGVIKGKLSEDSDEIYMDLSGTQLLTTVYPKG